jgi:uncharacterized protein
MAQFERIDALDALRGVALLGVLLVNLITEFRVSLFQQFLVDKLPSVGIDRTVEAFVSVALESKAFALFSILFGMGLAMQYERLSRGGRPFHYLMRRLVVLLGFGLLHLVFIWNGDILTEYALAGLLVLPLLRLPRVGLGLAAVTLFGLYVVRPLWAPWVAWPGPAALARHVAAANQVYATGGVPDVWRFSVQELAYVWPLHVFVFPRTLALFLAGALLWRSGVLSAVRAHRTALLAVAVVGIGGGLWLTDQTRSVWTSSWAPMRVAVESLAPVVLACGYGALVLGIAQRPRVRAMLAPFAAVGRMAFTNYILQSVIFGFIFFGYGLGRFGHLAAGCALLMGSVVYGVQAAYSTLWLRHFRFGPLEWLWRSLMYGRAQPFRWSTPQSS